MHSRSRLHRSGSCSSSRSTAASQPTRSCSTACRDIRDPSRDGCWTAAKDRTRGCGTNEGGIWTGGVEAAVIGNTVRRARWDGIETVGSSTRTTIVRNRISDTRTGVYLEHSTHRSLIARNVIVDALTGINVEWWHEGEGSRRNTFAYTDRPARTGIFVDVGGRSEPDRRERLRGRLEAGDRPPGLVAERGAGNRAAAPPTHSSPSSARWDDGRPAVQSQPALGQRGPARGVLKASEADPIAGGSALLFWSKIAGNAGFFVAVLILARALGPTGRGTIAFIIVTALVAARVASLGVGEATT